MNKTFKIILLALVVLLALPIAVFALIFFFGAMAGVKDMIFSKESDEDKIIKRAEYCRELTDKLALKDPKSSDDYLLKCLSEK